jgi:hypothetical protein
MAMVQHARVAWAWIEANREQLKEEISKPWVLSATDDEINDFLSRSFAQGADYDLVRDHLMFNFNSVDDIKFFIRQRFTANVCLFGSEYLDNNLDFYY